MPHPKMSTAAGYFLLEQPPDTSHESERKVSASEQENPRAVQGYYMHNSSIYDASSNFKRHSPLNVTTSKSPACKHLLAQFVATLRHKSVILDSTHLHAHSDLLIISTKNQQVASVLKVPTSVAKNRQM